MGLQEGPGHPVDPSKQVGTGDVVRYCYPGGRGYFCTMRHAGAGSYSFCAANGTEVVSGVTFKPGSASCA